MNQIKVGDKVRSFDFECRDLTGPRACYAEGVVARITPPIEGCARYQIAVSRVVFRGEESVPEGEYIYPPVNGTTNWMNDMTTNGVEKIS